MSGCFAALNVREHALEDLGLDVGVLCGEQGLGPLAVRAIGLREDGDDVPCDRGLVDADGC